MDGLNGKIRIVRSGSNDVVNMAPITDYASYAKFPAGSTNDTYVLVMSVL